MNLNIARFLAKKPRSEGKRPCWLEFLHIWEKIGYFPHTRLVQIRCKRCQDERLISDDEWYALPEKRKIELVL